MPLARTVLSSGSNEITITPDGPVVPIGERCNALGYRVVREALQRGNYRIFAQRAAAQQAAGARILNINVVCERVNEIEALPKAVAVMAAASTCPLSIDFSSADALEAALKNYRGRALINSVNGERAKMERVLPLMKAYGAAAIALPVDDSHGIALDPERRVAIAESILEAGARFGLGVNDFIIDGVVLGAATEPQSARVALETIRRLRERLGCNIALGASNAAFGLPERGPFNAHFLSAAILFGCNVPITDPTLPELKRALLIAEVLRGVDEYGIEYIAACRAGKAETAKVPVP